MGQHAVFREQAGAIKVGLFGEEDMVNSPWLDDRISKPAAARSIFVAQ